MRRRQGEFRRLVRRRLTCLILGLLGLFLIGGLALFVVHHRHQVEFEPKLQEKDMRIGQVPHEAINFTEEILSATSFVRQMSDHVTLGKAYLVLAKDHNNLKLAWEFSSQIRKCQLLLAEASMRGTPITVAEAEPIVRRLSSLIYKAQNAHYDIATTITTLKTHIQALEKRVNAAIVQSTVFGQLAAEGRTKSLHCLNIKLTVDWLRNPSLKELIDEQRNSLRLVDNNLYHFCIFSDNVLATSAVINSTISNADHPKQLVFHVVTDNINYMAMQAWFLTYDFKGSAIEVQNVEEFSWLNSSYSPVFKQLQEMERQAAQDLRTEVKFWKPNLLSLLDHLRFYVPEIYPSLERVVLLEDDVIVQKDLMPLFSLDLHGNVNGAVETCLEGFHRFYKYLNFSNPVISSKFDPQAPEVNDFHFSGKSLWTSGDRINPPMEDEALCMLKRQRRLAFFYLDNPNSGLSAITEESASRSCPILLLKNNQMGSCRWWSIILPLSWVKAFWIPLISNGARAIGLRERRWVSCNDGMPSFPYDFPDCKAYSSFMAAEAILSDQELDHQPLAMRPIRIPIPPPWDSVRATILEGSVRGGYDQLLDIETHSTGMAFSRSLVSSDLGDHDGTLIAKDSFQGLIARTSNDLSGYLNETCCRKLLLFPNSTTMGKNCFSKLMDEGRLGWAPKRDILVPVDRKLCFLRVLLHAYKEGVFEEGAVICAPILTDLPLWTDRSEEEDQPHIPQHLIESYFTQQRSGMWKLQIPEDPANQQSFRWPIGFVTSGFVRGSTKPAAEAFCDATLLAQLRAEQWREMQEKGRPDVFVLVRNLRSAAYRVALATIVLEQQQDDLEFM